MLLGTRMRKAACRAVLHLHAAGEIVFMERCWMIGNTTRPSALTRHASTRVVRLGVT